MDMQTVPSDMQHLLCNNPLSKFLSLNYDDITLEYEVKWALGSISRHKASEGYGIQTELFQILKEDTFKVLYSICQQIWKTQ